MRHTSGLVRTRRSMRSNAEAGGIDYGFFGSFLSYVFFPMLAFFNYLTTSDRRVFLGRRDVRNGFSLVCFLILHVLCPCLVRRNMVPLVLVSKDFCLI